MNQTRSSSDSSEDEVMRNEERRGALPLCPDEEEGGQCSGLVPLHGSGRDQWIMTTIVLKEEEEDKEGVFLSVTFTMFLHHQEEEQTAAAN